MGNLKGAPDWLTGPVVDQLQHGLDRGDLLRALAQLGLTEVEIANIEWIAGQVGMTPAALAGGYIRASIAALVGGAH